MTYPVGGSAGGSSIGLHMLPVGEGELTPERSREWLASDLASFEALVAAGTRYASEDDEEVFERLSADVDEMTRACTRVLDRGQPVRLVRAGGSVEDTECIVRVLGYASRLQPLHAPEERAIEALAEELLHRV